MRLPHLKRIARVLSIHALTAVALGPLTAQLPGAPLLTRDDFAWTFRALDGAPVTLEVFRGRLIVLTAWATWCEPCVAEMQSLQALRASVRDSSVAFVLLSPEREEPVRRFLARRAVTLPAYLEWSKAPAVFGFSAVPMTWIIDPSGRVVLRHRGARRWDTPAVRALLDSLRPH